MSGTTPGTITIAGTITSDSPEIDDGDNQITTTIGVFAETIADLYLLRGKVPRGGGFEIPLVPGYDPVSGAAWLEQGHVLVIANIRGGGEFGPAWHQSVLREKRQLAFDDFAAVARDLTYGWGVVPVRGRIGSTSFRTSLFPKDGTYLIPIKAAVRAAEGLEVGDRIAVALTMGVEESSE